MGEGEGLAARLKRTLPPDGWRTRFAPAPTGYLHLGHLVNALHVWGIARAYGGQVLLRIEDHDRTRSRPEYETALLEDLQWLGLDGDVGTCASFSERPHAQRQSDQETRYASALAQLQSRGLVYPCRCTRKEIAKATTRVSGDELWYPGTCRNAHVPPEESFARRVQIDGGTELFDDLRLGPLSQDPSQQCGDLLVRDRHANWTYQFAVSVDDAEQQIDVVIRGEDLLASTGRQRRLAQLLGRASLPLTLHHALLRHPDGTKLSKANGDTALRARRGLGATPAMLFGEAAHLVGLQATPRPIEVDEIAALFRETGALRGVCAPADA